MTAIRPALASLAFLLSTLLCGCGKDLSILDTPAQPSTGNWLITGNYQGSSGASSSIFEISIGGSLIRTGSTVSGVFHIYQYYQPTCFDLGSLDVPYTGTLTKNNLNITSSPVNGQVLTLRGVISSDGSSLHDGYFTITGGCTESLISLTGSNGPGASFDPTGVRLSPITGAWTSVNSSSLSLTEQLAQSPTPDAHGDFALTGTVTVQGSPCFTQGTIQPASFVSGGLGQQVIFMNDGSTLSATLLLGIPAHSSLASSLELYPATVTGGHCNGPVDIVLR